MAIALDAVEAGGRGGKEAEAGARIIASLLVHFLAASNDKTENTKSAVFLVSLHCSLSLCSSLIGL